MPQPLNCDLESPLSSLLENAGVTVWTQSPVSVQACLVLMFFSSVRQVVVCLQVNLNESHVQAKKPAWLRDFALRIQEKVLGSPHLLQFIGYLLGARGPGSWDPGGDASSLMTRILLTSQSVPVSSSSLDSRFALLQHSIDVRSINHFGRGLFLAKLKKAP